MLLTGEGLVAIAWIHMHSDTYSLQVRFECRFDFRNCHNESAWDNWLLQIAYRNTFLAVLEESFLIDFFLETVFGIFCTPNSLCFNTPNKSQLPLLIARLQF